MKSIYQGDILSVRAVEDCIRHTKKYTKGAFKETKSHPMQGEEFPSKVLTEYYEVYPDTEVSLDMPVSVFWKWLWGEKIHIDVRFVYDYRDDKARVVVYGGDEAVKELEAGIPDLRQALNETKNVEVVANDGREITSGAESKVRQMVRPENQSAKPERLVDSVDRVRIGPVPDTQ